MAPTKTIMNISMNIMQNHELAMHILIVPKIRNAFMVLIKCVALLMRFPVALVHFLLVKIQREGDGALHAAWVAGRKTHTHG